MNKKNKQNSVKENIGGIALNNGIIFKSEKKDVSTKISEEGKITVNIEENYISDKSKFSILELPFIRGIYNISSQLLTSKDDLKDNMKSICDSLNIRYTENDFNTNINIPFLVFIVIIIISLIVAIIPCLISIPFNNIAFIVQAITQFIIFAIFLILIKSSRKISTILEYHGTEHKIINAYENLKLNDITIENVKKASRIHTRCGTNFISFFILLTILETLFLRLDNIFIKMMILAIIVVPNISLSYELVVILSKLPKTISYLFYPIMAIQLFTTKNPSDDKIKLGIYGIKALINDNLDISIKTFLKSYKEENKDILEKKEYSTQDILRIISYVTNKDTNILYVSINEYMLNYNEQIEITRLLDMLFKDDVPLQYITKKTYFYNEEYMINKNVLIPREDTEILVQKAIEYINRYDMKDMIDLCTGSGCIGISVAKNSNIDKVILSDISKEALSVARKNIELNNAYSKVITYHSDLLELYITDNILVDIIVSNPPYIKRDDIKILDKKVQKEPRLALDGGVSGLDIYVKILEQARYVLKDNAYLMFEIGYDELNDLKSIIANYKEYELIETVKDYGGNDRVIICKFISL